jgi:hypothetical protein
MTHIDQLYPSVIKSHKIRCQITPRNIASSGALLFRTCLTDTHTMTYGILALQRSRYMRSLLLYGHHTFILFFMSFFALRATPFILSTPPPTWFHSSISFLFCSRIRCLAWIAKGLVLQDFSPSRLRSLAPFIFVACNFGPKPIETFFARGGSQTGCAC